MIAIVRPVERAVVLPLDPVTLPVIGAVTVSAARVPTLVSDDPVTLLARVVPVRAEAGIVQLVRVPLAGVPRMAPLPSVATPVTARVPENVPVVAATDDGVVAPSGCGVAKSCVSVVLRRAMSAAL